jgi:hypothetical protein
MYGQSSFEIYFMYCCQPKKQSMKSCEPLVLFQLPHTSLPLEMHFELVLASLIKIEPMTCVEHLPR